MRSSGFDPQQQRETQSIGDAVRYNQELAREVGDVEEGLERLKVRFDQFFMGLERREPQKERDDMKRVVARLKTTFTKNTGLKFRIQSLHARFISYERMWMRSAREKENGTYRRDLERARRHALTRGEAGQPAAAAPPPAGSPAVQPPHPAPPPQRPAAAAPGSPPPAAPAVPGVTPEALRALHAAYVDAKRRCNEDASKLTVDALAKSLSKQVPELLAKTGARSVEFRVAVKDGKTVLKAVPKS
jgi:hypothetical protein